MDQKDNNTIVMFDTENSIILGDYLDLLLNRTTEPRGGIRGGGHGRSFCPV